MRTLVGLLGWLATRAGADLRIADAGAGLAPLSETTADRAGQLVPVPQDGFEPEVSRSLGAHGIWWLWLAVAVVLVILAGGYVRRRWRKGEATLPAWFTWRARR